MIFDAIKHFKEDPSYNKLVKIDYMILEYKCPIDVEKLDVMLEWNFITFVISGKKDWITAGKTYSVKEGEALFLRKGVYTFRQYFEIEHCVLVFFMHDDFIRNFMQENSSLAIHESKEIVNDQAFPIHVDNSLESLFYSIYTYLKMGMKMPRNLVEIKFKELLFNIVLNPNHKRLAQLFCCLNQTAKTTLDNVMLTNFQYDLQLDEFARLCGRSLSAFRRDFKMVYHQTPGKWLNDKRLEYASGLLLSSDLNINEIGYESGFKNSSHFNKIFKDKYKLSPRQFRLRNEADVHT